MQTLTPYVVLIDAGDSVQGATIGTISNGRYIVEIMKALGYDLAVPGNHEFDYGMEQFLNFAKNLSCGYISCNFKDAVTGQLVFEPYRIFSFGNMKIAFVGACTPGTISSSKPSNFMSSDGKFIYDFDGDPSGKKLCDSIQRATDSARENGADFVILVGHLGEKGGSQFWSAPHIAANTRGIDAIIDGHSHEVTPCLTVKNLDGKEILITQSGTKLKYIGQLTIKPSGEIITELIKSGDIDYDDILKVSPFQDTICIYDVPGRVILDALELGVKRMPEAYGGLIHTAGLTYAVNTSIPSPVQVDDKNMLQNISGERRVYNVMVNGSPLEADKMYSVVSISYILSQYESWHNFSASRMVKVDFMILTDAIAHYVKNFGDIPEVYKIPQGRILIR